MIRFAAKALDIWLQDEARKPLVLKGARQVGKTWLVRDLAKRHKLKLVEINLERFPNLADLFSANNPDEILKNIEAALSIKIDECSSLLFLDEIQAAPELFAKLRWFKEEIAHLPVIAAGSLLEFALSECQYSMPVGRITYFYLEPMSFFEFVLASEGDALYEKLISFEPQSTMPQSLHEKCLKLYYDFCIIGGMPEVVCQWVKHKDVSSCVKKQYDLLATYRDDFHKYGGRFDAGALSRIMLSVAKQLGSKFVYSRVDSTIKEVFVKKALTMLTQARVCTKIHHTAGNGLPLGAESNEKFFKTLMVDIGLISVQLGLSAIQYTEVRDVIRSNRGGLAEHFVGQQLRAMQSPLADPELYYWQRIGGRQGEIDFIIQHENRVIPIEIKSGKAGSMKSLHQFMDDKSLDFAVRCNTNLPLLETVSVKTTLGNAVSYRLLSIPVYLVERLHGLIKYV